MNVQSSGLPKLRGLVQNQVGTYMKVISKTILYGLLKMTCSLATQEQNKVHVWCK